MKLKSMIPALIATFAISGVTAVEAGAQSKKAKQNRDHHSQQQRQSATKAQSGSLAISGAQADRRGASAGGAIGSGASTQTWQRGGAAGSVQVTAPNTATTYSTGAIYTDRNTATAAGSTGGTASGSGSQAVSSDLDVYGVVDKQGAEAGAVGGSTATSTERRRPR